MISTGSFAAKGVSPIEWSKSPEKGTPGAKVMIELKAGPNLGERVEWIGWLTEKTTARTSESLALMGYDGKDDSSVRHKEFIAVIEHEEYEAKSGEKKSRPRVAWINSPDGGGRLDPMTASEVAGAKERLKAALTAAKAKAAKPADDSDVRF